MAGRGSEAAVHSVPEELILTRVFDAPRKLVFDAWTRPEHLKAWWGPNGFTLPVCELDFRQGGAYRFVMRAPDGAEYPMQGVFREIEAPSRIVFNALLEGEPREILTTVTFAEQEGKTLLTVRQTRPHDAMKARGQKQGWTEQLEKLASFVGEGTG
jgi:uncharacterized protein YndB with AHSA1/START domain